MSDNSDEEYSWVSKFCSLKGNEFFCEVDSDYIESNFNFISLRNNVPYYKIALKTIRDEECEELESLTEEQEETIESSAEILYGLIHARYILTDEGMRKMAKKYQKGIFGRCPNVFCQKQPCLPVGRSDLPRKDTVKYYCPRCQDIYFPDSKYANLDGAYFGTTFANLLLQWNENLKPESPPRKYVPKIFGFRVHNTVSRYQDFKRSKK
ncbi:casein kinase ii subunit beta [Anaeramoeba flamelloides]|uniref:Casein kinase II subunit beta n=1 Tax=Anaeramoeba flamelloides TaxID=1746091 RepID=A0AAV7Z688_9EUKA|nr:casein kinase ii subunit beta [Anaeramoeba flamelloides]KAJ6230996.1 casein kinase ii subunit beta [Anaeramoeba flamelloides]